MLRKLDTFDIVFVVVVVAITFVVIIIINMVLVIGLISNTTQQRLAAGRVSMAQHTWLHEWMLRL